MDSKIPSKYKQGVTARAVLVGLALIPVNSYWIFMTEIIRYQGHPTTISLFYSAIFTLILLILLNGLIKILAPRFVFSQGELITIYIMLNIGSSLVGHDSLQILVSLMPYATKFATPDNKWNSLFVDRLPNWLVVKNPIAAQKFYTGGNLYDPAIYGAWLVPLMWWAAFIIVLVGMFLCINVLLRKQWTEREKLSYPLVQLPFDMTAEGAPLFREKLFWMGFGIAAAIDIINGLSALYPNIPAVPIKTMVMDAGGLQRPWNAIGGVNLRFYPFGIGLGMLLPVDLLFSCWFFYWVWRIQSVLTVGLGMETIRGMPFVTEQSFGAYMGICVFAIMISRHHFASLFRHFVGRKTDLDDSGEPIRYKTAIWLILLGSGFLICFSREAGMSAWVIIPFFLIYFAMSIAITRMRAELGPPAHDLHRGGPDSILPSVVGPKGFSTSDLSAMSMYFWFNRAYRSHVMPFQLEGFKLAERAKMNYRRLFAAMLIATIFGTVVAFWVILHLCYQKGAAQVAWPYVPMIFGNEPWSRMDGWLKVPMPADINRGVAIGVGFGMTLVLNSLRMRIGWFPFHPVGYAVSSSWSMSLLWFSLFIAWIIKLLVLRYGGLQLYRKALPLFLGIILGECVVGSFWTIWGILCGVTSYAFWP